MRSRINCVQYEMVWKSEIKDFEKNINFFQWEKANWTQRKAFSVQIMNIFFIIKREQILIVIHGYVISSSLPIIWKGNKKTK